MISLANEKKLLQSAVALACLVPLSAGLIGMLSGAAMLAVSPTDLDSHFRYLSGLLFAIGLGFASTIPHIERHVSRMRLLTFLVITGGCARFLSILLSGFPAMSMLLALVMEWVVTPLLCLWQYRIAKQFQLSRALISLPE